MTRSIPTHWLSPARVGDLYFGFGYVGHDKSLQPPDLNTDISLVVWQWMRNVPGPLWLQR